MGFAKFMAGPIGRGVRMLAGIVLIALGLLGNVGVVLGVVLVVLGAAAFAAGLLNFCLIAPLIGAPFSGKQALES